MSQNLSIEKGAEVRVYDIKYILPKTIFKNLTSFQFSYQTLILPLCRIFKIASIDTRILIVFSEIYEKSKNTVDFKRVL
jgi:hypothetical protein